MGGNEVAAGEAILNSAGIPTFPFPDTAVRVFQYMWRYSYNLRGLYETPTLAGRRWTRCSQAVAARIIEDGRASPARDHADGGGVEAAAAGLRHSGGARRGWRRRRTRPSRPRQKSVIRWCLKLNSATITHKTDVGGVQLEPDGRRTRCRDAFRAIQESVTRKAGAEHFRRRQRAAHGLRHGRL